MLIASPGSWTRQPDYFPAIRYDEPIGRQVRIALIGGYSPVEVCAGVRPAGAMGTAGVTAGGLALLPASTAITWSRDIFSLDPKTGNSIALHWYGALRADTTQTLCRFVGVYGWVLKTSAWATDALQFTFGGDWQGPTIISGGMPVTDNTLHSVTVITDAAAGTTTIYLDGVSIASGAWAGDGGAGFGEIQTGQVFSIVGHATAPHKMLTLQAFTGKLPVGAVATLMANPYHVFARYDDVTLTPDATAPGPTFQAAWARNSNAILTGTIQ